MNKPEIIQSTIEYIELQLNCEGEALSLDKIADKIGYSKFYLNRLFCELTDITIHRYILERRLTEAAKKLVYTDKPIIDIAYEAGYRSQQAFTNVFSNVYLSTPMKYRIQKQFAPLRMPYEALYSYKSYAPTSRMGAAA